MARRQNPELIEALELDAGLVALEAEVGDVEREVIAIDHIVLAMRALRQPDAAP